MSTNKDVSWLILVVEDIEETRDGIEKLLKVEGYRVLPARDEMEAIEKAKYQPPDLALVSLGNPRAEVIQASWRIRQGAGLKQQVPFVIFCLAELAEGAEVGIEGHIYLTHPDNFNQLRAFLRRLLHKYSSNPS